MSDRSLLHELQESGEVTQWDWDRMPIQSNFITAPETYTCMSGGFGAGKTTALCAKIILLMTAIPNNLGYLGRLDGKALRASTIQSLDEMLPKEWILKHNDQKGFIQLKKSVGGSKLIYGDFKDINDLKNMPLGFFAIDQMEEVPQNVFDYLAGRNRRRTPVLLNGKRQYFIEGACPFATAGVTRHYALHGDTNCRVCSASLPPFSVKTLPGQDLPSWDLVIYNRYGFGAANPEGPSHWIYKYFSGLPSDNGISIGITDEKGMQYKGFQATVYDGLAAGFVDRQYVKDLERLYANNESMRKRYLLGMWVEAEGLIYPDWRRDIHTFRYGTKRYTDEPLMNLETTGYEHIDHGTSAPTAVGFVLVEDCGCGCGKQNYYVIDEYHQRGLVVSKHAEAIKAKEATNSFDAQARYLDSQAFSKTLMGQKGTPREDELYSVADEYHDHGIGVIPNQKDWDAGYNRIGEVLQVDPKHVHPFTGKAGAPHLLVATRCTHFIEEFETYKWKKVKNAAQSQTSEPVDGNDDLLDGLNGFLTSRPSASEYNEEQRRRDLEAELDELDAYESASSHMGL